MKFAVVTGDSSGLGRAIAMELFAVNRCFIFGISQDDVEGSAENYIHICADVGIKGEVERAHDVVRNHILRAKGPQQELDEHDEFIIVNCAGINRIDWLESFPEGDWDQVLNTNAKSIFLMAQAFLEPLKITRGTLVNVVSNAAHMPMTGSLAYNASKGAAHIMTLQLARELTKRYGISVFGVAPNRMKGTAMSEYIDQRVTEVRGWTHEYAQEYQRNGLVTGEETDPKTVAEILGYLLARKERHHFLSGCVLPMGA